MQTGFQSVGHTVGFETFDRVDVEALARDAARMAITKLEARPAPSGTMPVVIKRGSGGVLFHEACGHGLEADAHRQGRQRLRRQGRRAGRLAERHARSTTARWPGSGARSASTTRVTPTQRNVLIENGVLTDYMWDFIRARKEGKPFRGNGRRESYRHLPMVRMTNTFVLDGPDDEDEIIRATDYGVYVAELGGGQVNPATGDFVFGMLEAYLIENGEITVPLREGNLIGNGPQVLRDIDMIAGDFAMGRPGHVRQGRPGRAGRRRLPDAARQSAHRRRDRSAREPPRELAGDRRRDHRPGPARASRSRPTCRAAARRRCASTRARSRSTSPRTAPGVGVRVIRDGRTGFAYAGTLDESALDEVVAEARDNVTFGTVDEWAGLAEPDGVAVTEQSLWSDELAGYPNEGKIELALELEQLALAADPRIRMDDANYADGWSEHAVATTTGILRGGRSNGCYVMASTLADEGDRDADRLRLQRRPASRRARPRPSPPATRRPGRPGCSAPPSRRASASRWCSPRSSRRSSCRSSARR